MTSEAQELQGLLGPCPLHPNVLDHPESPPCGQPLSELSRSVSPTGSRPVATWVPPVSLSLIQGPQCPQNKSKLLNPVLASCYNRHFPAHWASGTNSTRWHCEQQSFPFPKCPHPPPGIAGYFSPGTPPCLITPAQQPSCPMNVAP